MDSTVNIAYNQIYNSEYYKVIRINFSIQSLLNSIQ